MGYELRVTGFGYGLHNHNESVKKGSGVCSSLITHNPQPVTFFLTRTIFKARRALM